jgi:hypothetical protein
MADQEARMGRVKFILSRRESFVAFSSGANEMRIRVKEIILAISAFDEIHQIINYEVKLK